MEYRRFLMFCECGGAPKQIASIGFSSTHDIVIHWRCPRCHRNVCTVKSLSDCWRDCYSGAKEHSHAVADTPDDRRFLHSLGVRYPDE